MTTQFKILLRVMVAHAYYSENCEDVAFIAPAETAQWLRNGKLLTREIAGRLYILFEADSAGAALKSIPGRTLRFGLRVMNPFFGNFTQLDESFHSSTLLYRNAAAPAALDDPTKVQLVGHVFSHALATGARPVTVTLKDKAGVVLQTETIAAPDNRTTTSYDLTGLVPGAYSVEEDLQGVVTTHSYYSDAELIEAGAFGVIEVKIADTFYAAPPDFQIDFEARKETVNYYVVARNYTDNDLKQLSVADAGFEEDGRSQVSFDHISSDAFSEAEISPNLLTDGAGKVTLFQSRAAVARSEKARRKIQLKKNGDVLIAHLPQPRPENNNADLIISLSKP